MSPHGARHRAPRRSIVVLFAATVAVAATIATSCGASDDAVSSSATTTSPVVTATDTTPATEPAPFSDLADVEDPRVLLLGDSLLANAIADFEALFAEQDIEASYLGYPGTGLLTQLPEDDGDTWWAGLLRDGLADFTPDVVIIESCCNYEEPYVLPDGTELQPDTDAFYERWEDEANRLIDMVEQTGTPVFWVITPSPAPGAELEFPRARIDRFNEIYASLGVPLIDWQSAVTEAETLCRQDLHCSDGLHLQEAGTEAVVDETWQVLTGTG